MNRDEICFILPQMSQNYILKRFLVRRTNFEVISRVQTPYWTVKIDPFLTILPKLAKVTHTSPLGLEFILRGFQTQLTVLNHFQVILSNFLKTRFFGSRTCPDRRGLTTFPRLILQIFR